MNLKNKNCRSKKPISNCRSKKNNDKNRTLAALVSEYLQDKEDDYKIEDRWWGDKNITWSEAIERAWRSLGENGKMHDHQHRVGKQKLDEGLKICLSHNRQPDSFNNFHDIYYWIESITKSTYRLGYVTAYDVARRLGAWLGMQPKMVYLHGGAAKGAKQLGIKGEIVSLNDFPQEIRELGATHAENFLCIYKDFL
ncbi:MAG: hypothetical protein AAFR77_15145 [Cyanobacteria bacterium J06631_2]